MKIKLLSLLLAICMTVSLFPAAAAVEPNAAPVMQEHIHETEPVLPQAEEAPVLPQGIEEYPELEFGTEVVLTANGMDYSYATFTPETTGNYRISGANEWNYSLNGVFYDADMNYIDECYSCWEDRHEHPYYRTFCFTQKLYAGATYVLAFRFDESVVSFENVSIYVSCGHNYVTEITREATCAEPGIITHTCTVCGDSYVEEFEVDHLLVSEITEEGTCAKSGTIVHTCDVCGYQETVEYYTKHNYKVETIREAACEEEGLERYTCLNCGYSYDNTVYGSHDYQWTTIPGSCTEMSMEVGICSLCGDTTTYVDWYEHDYQYVTITEATCTAPGTRVYGCILCGENDGIEQSDPLGHAYGEDLKCIRCGETAATEGTWGDLSWTYADGVLTITGEGEMPELEFISAWDDFWIDNTPWKDLPVREAVIGEGITNVTAALFQNREELEKVTLPSTVTEIQTNAFIGCSNLTAVDLPEALAVLGEYAFSDCDLREIHIPSKTLNVYDKYGNLIAYRWFSGNRNLKSITVNENHPNMCTDEQGVLYNKNKTSMLFIPEGIEGTYTLPASVTEAEVAFFECSKLDTIEVEEGNPNYCSRDGMLYSRRYYTDFRFEDNYRLYTYYENVLLACPPARELGDYTIDAQTAALNDSSFRNCVNLTGLTIPKTCTINPNGYSDTVFRDVIRGCSGLEFVLFEEGHPDCFNDEKGFVYNARRTAVSLVGEYAAGTVLQFVPSSEISPCLQIPEGVEAVSAYLEHPDLRAIRFPFTLKGLDSYVLRDSDVEWILFTGDKPTVSFMGDPWATGLHADLYYPGWMPEWMSYNELDEDSTYVNYIPYEQGQEPVWSGDSPFLDVPVGAFYAAPVAWAVENNITSGATADSFDPNGQCLRAQVVTFLWRAEGCPKPTSTVNPFVDVKETDFYYDAVLWAVENNITSGSDATHFNPKGVCNRAQVVTFLHRAKNSPAPASMELPFTDVPSNAWYAAPVAWAVETGVTAGLTTTTFGPNAACNRAQVVTFLYRAYH